MTLTRRTEGKNAVDLLEEAVLLLRRLPFLSWAALYLGALPYVLVFLLYLMNLAHNPVVTEQLVGYSALLAVLFVWMKLWQTVFAAGVWRLRSGTSPVTWTFRSVVRIVRDHLCYSPVSLAGLAVSGLLVFPLAWNYALHHNLVLEVLPGLEGGSRSSALRRSWQQALLWPGQNHVILLLLGLISLIAFANFAACLVFFPYLLKLLTGWESAFTRLGVRLVDFKMLIAAFVLTYLALLPLVRVIYVLRCFYGSSRQTGADLLSELRVPRVAAFMLFVLLIAGTSQALAAKATREAGRPAGPAPARVSSVSPGRLDASITTVLQSRKHLWQAPGRAKRGQDPSLWRDVARAIERALQKLAEWLRWLRPTSSPTSGRSGGRSVNIRDLAIALLVVCAVALAVLVIRTLLERRGMRPKGPVTARAGIPVDLRRTELSPEELPEEKWLDLAREMMASGQARLAVRAIYLAAIVVLGKRDLVTPTRFKSNRDYLAELRRRHRGSETPVTSFKSMVSTFEKVWYGRHEPSPADFEEMHRLLAVLRV